MAVPRSLLGPRPHRFALPVEPFTVTTTDGVRLTGTRLGTADPAVVFCHGFLGSHRKPRVGRFVEELARWFTVYAIDLRGHGGSEGACTFGDREILDVAAALARARAEGHSLVATVGASMGGISVLRHAALMQGTDAVVGISAPARWQGHGSASVRRMQWFTTTRRGRQICRVAGGVRIADTWNEPEAPEDVVHKIAPTPLVVVHGRDDHYFDDDEAWRLYRRAGEPKRLLLASRFGLAEDGFNPEFAERLAGVLHRTWGLPWPA
jgi:pimeloyl-ACP methyl ester carboxylesterase